MHMPCCVVHRSAAVRNNATDDVTSPMCAVLAESSAQQRRAQPAYVLAVRCHVNPSPTQSRRSWQGIEVIRTARNVFAILLGLAFFGWLFWPPLNRN
jgi:hypothetical protein